MTAMTRRIRIGRSGLIALLVGLSTGCAQLSAIDARLQGADEQSESPTEIADRGKGEAAPRSLDGILADLQQGQYREARHDLRRYLQRHPDDAVARAVLRQLEADPARVLGEKSHRYVVQSGDSYSALAQRHLGDAGLFLVLARYNDSTNPSDLRIGEVIRLPGPPSGESVTNSTRVEAGAPARRSLAPAPWPSRATVEALTLPDAPLPALRPGEADNEPTAQALQRRGLALLEEGEREAALGQLEAALERDPSLEPAASRVPSLREDLVADYHQRAILRYRNQSLDEAIALWNRVLAIDPAFEPARSYRARARELQRRLGDL